jgi:hypothetical protein
MPATAPGVIAVGMGNNGTLHLSARINVEIADRAI